MSNNCFLSDVDLKLPEWAYSTAIALQCSAEELGSAFKRLARLFHPDKGGTEAEFLQIHRAYRVLANPELREVYDAHGERGVEVWERLRASQDDGCGSSFIIPSPTNRVLEEVRSVLAGDSHKGGYLGRDRVAAVVTFVCSTGWNARTRSFGDAGQSSGGAALLGAPRVHPATAQHSGTLSPLAHISSIVRRLELMMTVINLQYQVPWGGGGGEPAAAARLAAAPDSFSDPGRWHAIALNTDAQVGLTVRTSHLAHLSGTAAALQLTPRFAPSWPVVIALRTPVPVKSTSWREALQISSTRTMSFPMDCRVFASVSGGVVNARIIRRFGGDNSRESHEGPMPGMQRTSTATTGGLGVSVDANNEFGMSLTADRGTFQASLRTNATDGFGVAVSWGRQLLSWAAARFTVAYSWIRSSLSVDADGEFAISQRTRITTQIRVSSDRVILLFRLARQGMVVQFPIQLCNGFDWLSTALAVGGGIAPPLLILIAKALLATRTRRREAYARRLHEALQEKRDAARRQQAAMRRAARRIREAERAHGGLVILRAQYGVPGAASRLQPITAGSLQEASTDVEREVTPPHSGTARGLASATSIDSSTDRTAEDDEAGTAGDASSSGDSVREVALFDVTDAVQQRVVNSELAMPRGSKRDQLGFYHPCPSTEGPTVLIIRYSFAGMVYDATYDDLEEVRLPSGGAARSRLVGPATSVA